MTDNIEKRVEEFKQGFGEYIRRAYPHKMGLQPKILNWVEQALKETREEALREKGKGEDKENSEV